MIVCLVHLQIAFPLIPKKSPGVLTKVIDDQYCYAVNCLFPNSLRILTIQQYNVLSAIDGKTDTAELSRKLSIEEGELNKFLTLLSKTEIISFDQRFSLPGKPETPTSLNFWIHTTNKCNLSCSYCYISTLHTTGGMSDSVRHQLLLKLAETASVRRLEAIKLRLAGGEPLTQFRQWKSFICEAKSTLLTFGCDLEISFLTNLTILTDEIIRFAKDHGIGFGVSLDGIQPFNQARAFRSGKGTFSQVDRNLRRLVNEGIRTSVNTVITDENLSGLSELTQYLVDFDLPFRYSIVKGEHIDSAKLEQALAESYAVMAQAVESGWRFSKRFQFCDLKPVELGFQTCASGFSGGAIYVDGRVNYCHVDFGDVNRRSFSIFDEGMDLVDMIEAGEHDEEARSEDCKICKYRSICTSGCPVYRVNGKDPQCSIYHKFIPQCYDLHAKERLKLLKDYKIIQVTL